MLNITNCSVMKTLKFGLFALFVLFTFSTIQSCSNTPNESRAKKDLTKMINEQSKGKISLVDFKKINGFKNTILGQEVYTIQYSYTILFNDQGWKLGNELSGYFGNFIVYDEEPNVGFDILNRKAKHFEKGEKYDLQGVFVYAKTDNGWEITKF